MDQPVLVTPFVRSENNYDRNVASDESGIDCVAGHRRGVKIRTKQSFKEDSDINTILKRFRVSGQLPVGVRMPTYGDFTAVSDFHTAMNAVREAAESFAQMPANIRKRFDNDAGKFVDFCSDENNRAEAEKLGLVIPKAPEPVVAPAAPVATSAPVSSVAPAVEPGKAS